RPLEHRLGEVGAHDLAARRDPPGQLEGEVAGAGSDIEHAVAGSDRGEIGRARAPAAVQSRGHDRVHPVVDAGDAIEHRTDLSLLEGAGLTRHWNPRERYFIWARKFTSALNFSGGRLP